MSHLLLVGRIKFLSLLLAFFAGPFVLRADYTPPSSATTLIGDFVDFVDNFSSWNASLHNEPLLILASAPDAEKSQTFLMLFGLWLEGHLPTGTGSPFLSEIQTLFHDLGLSGLSSTGSAGSLGNGSSLSSLSTRNFIPDEGINPAISPLPGQPSSDGNPSLSGDPTPVPEPASLALLGIGAIGLLMLRMGREGNV